MLWPNTLIAFVSNWKTKRALTLFPSRCQPTVAAPECAAT